MVTLFNPDWQRAQKGASHTIGVKQITCGQSRLTLAVVSAEK
jgi:hypothetical protein